MKKLCEYTSTVIFHQRSKWFGQNKIKLEFDIIWQTWNILGNDTSRFDMLMPTVVRPPIKNRGFKQSPEKQDFEKLSEFTDPSQYPYEVGIIRQFTFR